LAIAVVLIQFVERDRSAMQYARRFSRHAPSSFVLQFGSTLARSTRTCLYSLRGSAASRPALAVRMDSLRSGYRPPHSTCARTVITGLATLREVSLGAAGRRYRAATAFA
jgi:hypothetical protein